MKNQTEEIEESKVPKPENSKPKADSSEGTASLTSEESVSDDPSDNRQTIRKRDDKAAQKLQGR